MLTLLVLTIAPELEEDLTDCLLELPEVNGFTTHQVSGHGEGGHMSIAEQVSGQRKRLQVELIVPAHTVNHILTHISETIGGDGVYWEQPVRNLGRFSDAKQE
ncbi:MAG: DUF3240 family protein [Pseudomonadales bacterium]|jgi:nitrogen regulatory protein PII|nr:DUF3240 family protein [Pseudomonadales bacterium]